MQYKERMTGVVRANERGFAFISTADGKDFFVPSHSLNGAAHGDTVLFAHVKGTDDQAVILSVLSRNPSPVVGTFISRGRTCRVYPDDQRRPDVFIPRDMTYGAESGQKVVCQVTSYPKGKPPAGKIVEILGEEGQLSAEEESIIRAAGLRTEFPADVEKEAKRLDKTIGTAGRVDLRGKKIFTIDGEDTRDIDDAVSLEIKDSKYVLGVHIADVGHYVKAGSRLDEEAYLRGTSVYFPDRVLPMLPKELSNGICSLNEGCDRYALTCEMTFDGNGNRINYNIFESVISSVHKTSYPQITALLEDGVCGELGDIADVCRQMKELCILLEENRRKSGCVELDITETKIHIDGDGNITIPPCARTISERIIEQFMIAANEAVAEYMQKGKIPCLYRVHERPTSEKTADLAAFLSGLGIAVRGNSPKDFADILKQAENKPFAGVVNKVTLRSMQKAVYSDVNLGHFGLNSKCYCHFTSPIRRYPDLFVHRALKCALHGDAQKAVKLYGQTAAKTALDSSDRERISDEAERNIDGLYILAYMSDRLGEEYDGVISGVTANDVYYELDNGVEGVIPIGDLPPDSYTFYREKFLLKGRKHSFALGDAARVKIAACDLGRMKVIMKICL